MFIYFSFNKTYDAPMLLWKLICNAKTHNKRKHLNDVFRNPREIPRNSYIPNTNYQPNKSGDDLNGPKQMPKYQVQQIPENGNALSHMMPPPSSVRSMNKN